MDMGNKADLTASAGAAARAPIQADRKLSTHYRVECYRRGELLWVDEFDNLVTTAGLNDSLDKHLKGSSYSAAWYVGLTDGTPEFAAGDTMASHAGWSEVAAYDELVRQTLTLGSVSGGSVDNSSNKAVFTISTNSTTVGGAFVASTSAKHDDEGHNTGILYGGGAFTAGDKSLDDNDTLTVTVTLTASAA